MVYLIGVPLFQSKICLFYVAHILDQTVSSQPSRSGEFCPAVFTRHGDQNFVSIYRELHYLLIDHHLQIRLETRQAERMSNNGGRWVGGRFGDASGSGINCRHPSWLPVASGRSAKAPTSACCRDREDACQVLQQGPARRSWPLLVRAQEAGPGVSATLWQSCCSWSAVREPGLAAL